MEPLAPVRRDDALALWRQYTATRTRPAPPEDDRRSSSSAITQRWPTN